MVPPPSCAGELESVKKSGVGDQCKLRMSAHLPCGDHGTHAARPPDLLTLSTYGIAALVAGGIAAKLGFFKGLWVALFAAKKFIIIGIIALVVAIKKFFGKGKNVTES